MRRRGNIFLKVLRLKAMGFLCGVAMFLATFAIAGDDEDSLARIEGLLIPILSLIVGAGGWYIRSVDRKLEKLSEGVSAIGSRISHIEGKLDISQTGGHQR